MVTQKSMGFKKNKQCLFLTGWAKNIDQNFGASKPPISLWIMILHTTDLFFIYMSILIHIFLFLIPVPREVATLIIEWDFSVTKCLIFFLSWCEDVVISPLSSPNFFIEGKNSTWMALMVFSIIVQLRKETFSKGVYEGGGAMIWNTLGYSEKMTL